MRHGLNKKPCFGRVFCWWASWRQNLARDLLTLILLAFHFQVFIPFDFM